MSDDQLAARRATREAELDLARRRGWVNATDCIYRLLATQAGRLRGQRTADEEIQYALLTAWANHVQGLRDMEDPDGSLRRELDDRPLSQDPDAF